MRRLIQLGVLLTVLGWTSPAHANWVFVQKPSNGTCATSSATCTLTVTSTTPGSLLVAEVLAFNAADRTISSLNTGGTWVIPAGCHNFSSSLIIACAYVLSATGGTTSIQVTMSGTITGAAWDFTVREYTYSGTASTDGTTTTSTSAGCTACTGPTITVVGNSVKIAGTTAGSTASSINAPYTNSDLTNSNCVGDHLNTITNTAMTCNQSPSAAAVMNIIAFKESSAQTLPWYEARTVGPFWAISLLIGLLIGTLSSYMGKVHGISENSIVYRTGSMAGNHTGPGKLLPVVKVIELVREDPAVQVWSQVKSQ